MSFEDALAELARLEAKLNKAKLKLTQEEARSAFLVKELENLETTKSKSLEKLERTKTAIVEVRQKTELTCKTKDSMEISTK